MPSFADIQRKEQTGKKLKKEKAEALQRKLQAQRDLKLGSMTLSLQGVHRLKKQIEESDKELRRIEKKMENL